MVIITFLLISQLSRTSAFISIPTVTEYDIHGMWGGGINYSFPLYKDDPIPDDNLEPEPADFNMVLRYGFAGRGEIALSMFTPTTYALSVSYVFKKEGNGPAIFGGIDNISYNPYISNLGMRDTVGYLEEKGYALGSGGRPAEIFSTYIAIQKSFAEVFNMVIGIGRGRFVGYGERSHIFNTDLFVLGDDYETEDHSWWAFGLFFGGSIRFPFGLEFIAEMDGRDGSIGIKYHNKYVTPTIAITKVEQFGSNLRPFSPRLTFGIEANNRFMYEGPKVGSIECVIQDNTSKELLPNSVIEIKELNKKYTTTSGTFALSLPAGVYTIVVSRTDYVDYFAKVSIKDGAKSTLIFNLNKTEEALKREEALREKERNIKSYVAQGKIYFSEDQLNLAKASFEMVLSLDPDHAEAKEYLPKIEVRRTELIAGYSAEAASRTRTKDFAKAIELWQKVLELNPKSSTATSSITELQNLIAAAKKPPAKPTKPAKPAEPKVTEAEIDALYKKGVSLFTAEKYDEALNVFKQVLALDPNHTGAKEYKRRTEARLQVLKSEG